MIVRGLRLHVVTWLLTALALLLLVAYAVIVLVGGSRATGALTGSEQGAVDSAARSAANLLTYSQKNFAADFAQAQAGTTGGLRTQITASQAKTKAALVASKVDLSAVVQKSAFEAQNGSSVLVLVTITGYQTDSKGTKTPKSTSRLELTMQKVGGAWLASNLTSIGVI